MAVFEGNFTQTESLKFAIVIGRFNDLITGKLLAGCQDAMQRHGIDVSEQGNQVDYIWVPGCFEVALVARQLAMSDRYDAVICLGAVIRGHTPHFDYVAAEVSKGIAAAGFQTGVPVIFGILTADTMQQALERAGIKSNKGWDYGMNAIEMASLMRQFKIFSGQRNSTAITSGSQTLPAAGSPKSAIAQQGM
ncbi:MULTISPECIES: 6,7-dimethyl-8-ribityllumazine synthase [Planktothricoides]|uniref:6,7-dimethyl-8-ribityllumazine synthase n=2 Tax=Planktothricoides raciborskii TaxID=132608 RepID=A0AAU8JJZ2_9CYAN|nr:MULTISPECIES: 6,7-dimethyl-8-ribityllumazine synthase [Planktothricoides]KOR34081.1 6,7-dimethyl-8-ribityllumazine synthase [Planktothricoides sp. SR001]MBD2547396.1 6,7-dimethyl-8-ribityllumazine synthase [Planktothricoides raciborskii FACHB-1370]MBD2584559.1 6,7-dimethyl-8-ribityllumazine synthase [Planktothricoides raciborskii FACHB-1261]